MRVLRAGRVHVGDAITLAEAAGPALAAPPADAAHPLAPPPAQWPRYAQVVGRVRESAEVDSFWLRDPLARLRPAPLPGQHLRVGLPAPDARPYWRSYTISAVEDGLLRLSIKNERERDAVSRQLHAGLREGAQLLISGPTAAFIWDRPTCVRWCWRPPASASRRPWPCCGRWRRGRIGAGRCGSCTWRATRNRWRCGTRFASSSTRCPKRARDCS